MKITRETDLETLELVDARGVAAVELRITGREVTLLIHGADLSVRTSGALSIDAARIALRGREGVAISSGEDLSIDAGGSLSATARAQTLIATRGSVQVTANDDVILDGERILLNP